MADWPRPATPGPDALGEKPQRSEFTIKQWGKNRERGEEKEKMKAKGTYTGVLFLCHMGRGDTDHVLPFTKDQKCYRAFAITSCFQQIGNNFSKYGLVSQSSMGSVSFHWEYILASCSIYVKALSETQNILLVSAMTRHKEDEKKKYLFLSTIRPGTDP